MGLAGCRKAISAQQHFTSLHVWNRPGLSGLSGLSGPSGESHATKQTRQTEQTT